MTFMQCCGGVSKEKEQENFLHQVPRPIFQKTTFKKSQLVLSSWACLFTEGICRRVFTTATKVWQFRPKGTKILFGHQDQEPHPLPSKSMIYKGPLETQPLASTPVFVWFKIN
jgi:hypothetical protein